MFCVELGAQGHTHSLGGFFFSFIVVQQLHQHQQKAFLINLKQALKDRHTSLVLEFLGMSTAVNDDIISYFLFHY